MSNTPQTTPQNSPIKPRRAPENMKAARKRTPEEEESVKVARIEQRGQDITDPTLDQRLISLSSPRLVSFGALTAFLKTYPEVNICNLDMRQADSPHPKKQSFSSGESADAYRIVVDERGFAAKVMKATDLTIREVRWNQIVTRNVLAGGFPHFPLISRTVQCTSCRNRMASGFDLTLEKIGDEGCIVMFSELADGDASSFFSAPRPESVWISFVIQVLMACLVLERSGVIHNDLHFGNILYHSQPENSGKWFSYQIGEESYYVCHAGELWTLWDFGLTVKDGELDPRDQTRLDDSFYTDIARTFIGKVRNHTLFSNFPTLSSLIQTINSRIDSSPRRSCGVADVVGALGSSYQDYCKKTLGQDQLVNVTPYQIFDLNE